MELQVQMEQPAQQDQLVLLVRMELQVRMGQLAQQD
jgi:hypothetical protein